MSYERTLERIANALEEHNFLIQQKRSKTIPLEENRTVQSFINTYCLLDTYAVSTNKELYAAFQFIFPNTITKVMLFKTLSSMGFKRYKNASIRGFKGIRLNTDVSTINTDLLLNTPIVNNSQSNPGLCQQ